MKRLLAFLFSVLFSFNGVAESVNYFYVLQKSETASLILHRARLLPLYNKRGSLSEFAIINHQNIRDINRLEHGELLYFTKSQVTQAMDKGLISVTETKEIHFTDLAYAIQLEKLREGKSFFVKRQENNFKAVEVPKVTESTVAKARIMATVISEPTRAPANDKTVSKSVELVPFIEAKVIPEEVKIPASSEHTQVVVPVATLSPPQFEADDSTYSEIALSAGAGYSVLNGKQKSNNTKAQILSKINSQFQFRWLQNWDDDIKTSFFVGYKAHQFEPDYRSTPVYNAKIDALNFGFDYQDRILKTLSYNFGLEQSQELFYRGLVTTAANGIELNAVSLSSLKLGLSKSFLKKGRYELGALLSYRYIIGSEYQDYTIENGQLYSVRLFLDESRNGKNVNCGVAYQKRDQNTSYLLLSETAIDLSCFYKWSY